MIRVRLRKIEWLARFYRKYIIKLPFDHEIIERDYLEVKANNDVLLEALPLLITGVKITIITPVYKPNLIHFNAMLASVFNQSYSNWQLILVDDCSKSIDLDLCLREAEKDPRVTVVRRAENGHISKASNNGLEQATGEYIALLDHDDLLQIDALKAVIFYIEQEKLNANDVNILYSDEDKINEEGEFEQAHFKPQWNPDLLYSHNYICHLGVYKKSLLDQIGGFRVGVEGSQDYDLLLRAVKVCNAQNIIHIPYVLYHWRIAPGSTALAGSEKNYTDIAGLKALQEHFSDQPIVDVEAGLLSNTYKVNWPIPEEPPLVSIIIPTKNAWELVKQCLDSLYELTAYEHFEVLLVDNQSDDMRSLNYFNELIKEDKIRLLRYNDVFNYSAINNYAVTQAKGEIIVLMNNDIEILTPNWLTEMVSHCLRDDIGCVGAKLYYPNNTIQHAGVVLGIGGVAGHSHKYFPKNHPGYFKRLSIIQNYSAVTAACLAVKKSIFDEVGGLNEKNLAIAFNDVDFCLRVQELGYRNLWTPYAEMIHHESVSRGGEDTPEKQARFANEVDYMKQAWGEQLMIDPCYSSWLSLDREDFTLR